VARPASSKELQAEIERMQSEVISQRVTLVVIDSISALARKEGFNEKDKEAFFLSQASLLKKMAEACHCVVLATNQVHPHTSISLLLRSYSIHSYSIHSY
jgi:RecA/RadA recombinase